jgi:nickel-dependent lactate racemase
MNEIAIYELQIGSRDLKLQLPSNATEISCMSPPSEHSIDVLMESALDEPIEFPPLPLALLEDDRIAIAVEDGLPDADTITCALVRYLVQHGTRQSMITVVLGADNTDWLDRMRNDLRSQEFGDVRVVKHEPTNQDSHGYVGASNSADPIYIQRDLFEAEVVLPIYCIRTPDSPSASDKYGMSPCFANAATQHRWNLAWLEDNAHHLHLQEKLSDEAGWLMGVQFAIVVVPAFDGSVSTILGGKSDSVFQRASEMVCTHDEKSQQESNRIAIAFVEGDELQQSWMNVARAAAHAEIQLETEGSIVVCCDVKHLSLGIQQLGTDEPEEKLQRRLLKSDMEDAFAAAVLSSIKSRRSIYLMSRLSAHQVESLGLAFIHDAVDIERLCQSANSVCAMRSAQF